MRKTDPVVTVIICTYNRAELLRRCLDSLMAQQADPESFDIIVVDNNSTDSTRQLVSGYAEKNLEIKYVLEVNQGLSFARNRGYAESKGEYIAYVDDDAVAPPDYVSGILNNIRLHNPDIAGGPVYPYYTGEKPKWFRDEYEIRRYAETSGFSLTCGISGSNFIIRRKVLESLGLFDTDFGMKGDEIGMLEEYKVLEAYRTLTEQEKQRVFYSLDIKVLHHVHPSRMKLKYIMKRRWVTGEAFFRLREKDAALEKATFLHLKLPVTLMLKLLARIRQSGLFSFDPFFYLLRDIFYYLGYFSAYIKSRLNLNYFQ